MNNITKNMISKSITKTICEVIAYAKPEIYSGMDADEIKQELERVIDSDFPQYELTYTNDAYDVVGGTEFTDPLEYELDFSGTACSLECVRIEGQAIIDQFVRNNVGDILGEIAEELAEVCETVANLSDDLSIKMITSIDDQHGWNAHNYETESRTCVHLDIENEKGLTAVSGGCGLLCLSAVFNKVA